jgi:hypothetical protein
MPCRICLEDEGPFISPCLCSGTMKDIHEECLLKWIHMNTHNPFNRARCELCHFPFLIRFNYPLEKAAYLYGPSMSCITNPAIHVFLHCIVLLTICNNNFETVSIDRFMIFQISYNLFFFFIFFEFIRARVVNKLRYLYILLTFPNVLLILGNIILWKYLIDSINPIKIIRFTIASLAAQAYMGLYPIFHNQIIDKINNSRQPVISLRDGSY